MKIIVFVMYWLVDLQLDGFLIFTAGLLRTAGRGYLAAQCFWTGAVLPPQRGGKGLGNDRKGRHFKLMMVRGKSASALAGLRTEDVCSMTKRFVLINRSDCVWMESQ